ncbi:HAD-IB family hydrolase [Colwelliaceae bacterium MEBiC 14330]
MTNHKDERPVVAVFDFDRTITNRHTFWRFLIFLIGPVKFWLIAVTLIPAAIRYLRGNISMMQAREVMIRRCMKGVSYETYKKRGLLFAQTKLNQWLNQEAIEKLRWHQQNNHRCLLISNSADCYLEPWSIDMGFESMSGSRFEQDQEKLTGKLIGEHCQGPEKLVRLKGILGDTRKYSLYAYGDSVGDKELLDIADYPFLRCFN